MKTIKLTDEQYEKVKQVLDNAKEDKKTKTTIYKRDGSVLYESDKDSLKEALEEAVEKGAYLGEADLGGANLGGAYLGGAYLGGADLGGANLGGADLGGANLGGADLGEANLGGAYLGEAELGNAKFYGKGGTTKIKKSQLDDFLKALGIIVED